MPAKGTLIWNSKKTAKAPGNWPKKERSIKFKWRVEDNRIWVYTKEGGIIHVTPVEGGQKLTVDMTGQWHSSCPVEKCITFERVKGGGS
jgi:hypothetical protein